MPEEIITPLTPIRAWMDSHGIDYRVAADCGLYATKQDTLFAPYTRSDGSTFERYRIFPDGVWMQPKGESLCLWWPLGHANHAHVLLTEGEGDTLAAASILDKPHVALDGLCPVGIPGLGMGADRIAAELWARHTERVFVCLDGDEPGRKATKRIVAELTKVDIEANPIWLPDGKDLSEYLMHVEDITIAGAGADALANLIADAEAKGEAWRNKIIMAEIHARLGLGHE